MLNEMDAAQVRLQRQLDMIMSIGENYSSRLKIQLF